VLEASTSLQHLVLFPSICPLPVSTGPWCLLLWKVLTTDIPVYRMPR
jgi:hypothetical protein